MGSRGRLLSQRPLNVERATLQWARIGSVAGAASDTTYTDAAGVRWRCVQWTANGSLVLVVAGAIQMLVVGGGGGGANYGGRVAGAGAGAFVDGMRLLDVGTHAVTVGAGGAAGYIYGGNGGTTSLGPIKAGGGGAAVVANTASAFGWGGGGSSGGWSVPDAGALYGGGQGGAVHGSNYYDGRTSTLTGSAATYAAARASSSAGTAGLGEGGGLNAPGGSGVVILCVPA